MTCSPALYQAGLGKSKQIKNFAMHYYQTHVSYGRPLATELLDHATTVARTAPFRQKIADVHASQLGLPFVLGEVGSALGQVSS